MSGFPPTCGNERPPNVLHDLVFRRDPVLPYDVSRPFGYFILDREGYFCRSPPPAFSPIPPLFPFGCPVSPRQGSHSFPPHKTFARFCKGPSPHPLFWSFLSSLEKRSRKPQPPGRQLFWNVPGIPFAPPKHGPLVFLSTHTVTGLTPLPRCRSFSPLRKSLPCTAPLSLPYPSPEDDGRCSPVERKSPPLPFSPPPLFTSSPFRFLT